MGMQGEGQQRQTAQVAQVDAFRRAYLEMVRTRAVWRVAQDCEWEVAHWMLEGGAHHADLEAAREVTREARKAFAAARGRYNRLSIVVAARAGARAGTAARLRRAG